MPFFFVKRDTNLPVYQSVIKLVLKKMKRYSIFPHTIASNSFIYSRYLMGIYSQAQLIGYSTAKSAQNSLARS